MSRAGDGYRWRYCEDCGKDVIDRGNGSHDLRLHATYGLTEAEWEEYREQDRLNRGWVRGTFGPGGVPFV